MIKFYYKTVQYKYGTKVWQRNNFYYRKDNLPSIEYPSGNSTNHLSGRKVSKLYDWYVLNEERFLK